MRKLIDRLQGPNSGPLVLVLGGTGAVLLLVAIIGAFTLGGGHKKVEAGSKSEETTTTVPGTVGSIDTGSTLPGATASTLANGQPATGGSSGSTAKAGTTSGGTSGGTTAAGDTTGVSATAIKWGLHAPKTIDGAPLNLAADPLEGVDIYAAALGDFSGRKIDYHFADDRYTVDGGKAAAVDLIDTQKVFFAEGTLGVDQIAQVAAEAKKRGTPYMAGGGSEKQFKDIGMFQIAGSYDSHLVALAKHLATETAKQPCTPAPTTGDCAAGTSPYGGKTNIGVSVLNSPYINGPGAAIDVFKSAITQASGGRLKVVHVVTIEKPTDQTSYGSEITDLKSSPATEILVPAQDPISTSRMVAECRTQNCPWNYAMSDFANDSDVGITLMAGNGTNPWVGMHNLSGGCYYLPDGAGHNPYETSKCGNLKVAHELWVAAKGESDWVSHGQGGASGYQVTHFWLGALKSLGSNVTRERFVAALRAYNGYSDLVTAPLSFQNSTNIAHGLDKFAIYQGTTTPSGSHPYSWKQISDGIVGSF